MSDPCAPAPSVLRYEQALSRLLQDAGPLPARTCTREEAFGRILAEDVLAPIALPGFDNAAMDGFALHTDQHVLSAGSEFSISGTIVAGDAPPVTRGVAWEIMTGAPLPPGTDTVVPIEHTERLSAGRMRLTQDIARGRHLRRMGSDVAAGTCVAAAGTQVDATLDMLLAALGITQVSVRPAPRVALLCTGKELVTDPTQALRPGQIRASNGAYLARAVQDAGGHLVAWHTVDDNPAAFARHLDAVASQSDLVLTTGAVSAGVHDFIPEALAAAGARTVFRKAAIRPGKPLLASQLEGGPLVLSLPGNPVASVVGMRFFAVPWLRARQGQAVERPLRARLSAAAQPRTGLRQFLKARVTSDPAGQLQVELLHGQESYRIGALLDANAWAVIDEDATNLPAGTLLAVYPRDAGGRWTLA